MTYQKITLAVVVKEDDSEMFTQALNDALDRIEKIQTVFSSEIRTEEVGKPENAEEIESIPQ
ncbi:hypothetical protein [Edaphobacter modestus]|uniref:Uncharacterized protein n=1 Tax=Edaphobacter modestus TaxID=388466 RepID=A0A4Q7YEG3_9BACT|nr:hypothetical protein [Edaphobacter modestus]RZU35762.1 hypothetical protein BDD14_5861 [Edaphobacter modestus]